MGSNAKNSLMLEQLQTGLLVPHPRNPRQHSERQIRQIAQSIKIFGFNVPILVDNNNNVIAGHGRASAARYLGYAEVPVLRLSHLTKAQARAFAIADNRLTENSTWDDRLLGEVLSARNQTIERRVK